MNQKNRGENKTQNVRRGIGKPFPRLTLIKTGCAIVGNVTTDNKLGFMISVRQISLKT